MAPMRQRITLLLVGPGVQEATWVCDQTWAGFFDLIPTGVEEQILSLSGSEGDHAVTGGDCVRGVV